MRILLHVCCGPCALWPLEVLTSEGHEVTALFHNPNIHPVAEYARRRDVFLEHAASIGLKVIVKDEAYDLQAWFREVAHREANRCLYCYRLRLEPAYHIARRGGFDAFTTTLLYSKRQKHDRIIEVGRDVAASGGPEFLARDFREGWAWGIEKSKELGMYRQDYCGCLYSDLERRGKELLSLAGI